MKVSGMVLFNVVESINTAKMYAKQLEEELFSLMDAHNIDAIRRKGAEEKVKNLHNALAEIEKATKKPKQKPVERPKQKTEGVGLVDELRPTPTKSGLFGKK